MVGSGMAGAVEEAVTDSTARAYLDMSTIHQSRNKRAQRPKKPEFAMTGILVGMVVGWIVGLGIELRFKQNMLIMMGTGIAGLVLGAGFEAIRFWWRMRRFRVGKQSGA
jgi:uncharacterized membrane protein YcjF (UPF0283 family)